MEISRHYMEKLEDPTGILVGDRFEFILYIEVSEDDELFTEQGLHLKAILVVNEASVKLAQYNFFENNTNRYIDFGLEEDEETQVIDYCKKALNLS